MTDYGRSLIRTIVPLIVGSLVAWLATRGVEVDRAVIMPAADAIFTAVYYGVIRWMETKFPKAGWLLGVPGAPTYSGGSTDGIVPVPSSEAPQPK